MTKEQAIEILKCFKDNKIQRDKLELDNRCGGWKIGRIYKSLELNTATETVLSILEEQEKKHANTLLESIDNIKTGLKHYAERCSELENELKLYQEMYENKVEEYDRDIHILQNQLDLANAKNIEKDKIIDLMLDAFSELIISDTNKNKPTLLWDKGDIKQYFENKVKETEVK